MAIWKDYISALWAFPPFFFWGDSNIKKRAMGALGLHLQTGLSDIVFFFFSLIAFS